MEQALEHSNKTQKLELKIKNTEKHKEQKEGGGGGGGGGVVNDPLLSSTSNFREQIRIKCEPEKKASSTAILSTNQETPNFEGERTWSDRVPIHILYNYLRCHYDYHCKGFHYNYLGASTFNFVFAYATTTYELISLQLPRIRRLIPGQTQIQALFQITIGVGGRLDGVVRNLEATLAYLQEGEYR
ncbi:hypothetical protein ACS0TY_001805 [Phlomoides rotata]